MHLSMCPLLGVCCESTVLRGSIESRGIQCINMHMPYKENSRFLPTRETGNLKINMAETDLSTCE